MTKNPVDPGQGEQSGPASRLRQEAHRLRAFLTPVRVIAAVLTLVLLLLSVAVAQVANTRSYASTATGTPNACVTVTPTPTSGHTTTGGGVTPTPTATPTPRHGKPGVTPTTQTTTTLSPTPTDTPTPAPSATGSVNTFNPAGPGATDPLSASVPLGQHTTTDLLVMYADSVQCTPTTTVTSDVQTPDPNSTPTTAPQVGMTSTLSTPNQSGGGTRMALIVGSVFLVLLAGLAIGWFFFRRMLLPQNAAGTNLPPSGARPWSRTRVPSPDSMHGGPANFGPGGPANFGPGGPTSPVPQGMAMNNGYNGPIPPGFGAPGGNGAGFGNFSDGFIPPSPQVFPQSENSMIPPGSGAFPVIGNANGFAPANPAFNAMYGLPDDPFAGSQGGSPGWMTSLGNGSGNPPPQNGGGLAPGMVDLNDPHLAEVIRQYSKKSQTVPPPPQPMAPNGPPQMSPSRPLMAPNGPPQMSPNGLPMAPNGPPQMPPSRPPQQIPQREPRTGFQDSGWLQ